MKVVMTRHYLLTIHRCQSNTSSLCVWEENGELDVDDGQRRGDRYGMGIGIVYCNGVNINKNLVNEGLARILTDYCDISEFSKEKWASSCS